MHASKMCVRVLGADLCKTVFSQCVSATVGGHSSDLHVPLSSPTELFLAPLPLFLFFSKCKHLQRCNVFL